MAIEPSDIIFQQDGGTSNMGSLTLGSDSDTNNKARFGMETRFAIKFIRIHFRGSGSGVADCTVNIDSKRGPDFDTELWTLDKIGKGTDANFRVPLDELGDWTFQPGDRVVLLWTNPDSGNIAWGAEVGVIEVDRNATR